MPSVELSLTAETFPGVRRHVIPGMKEYKKYGKFAYLVKLRNGIWRNMGGCLAR